MKQLWAPWRMEFLLSDKKTGCPFCLLPAAKQDTENLILHRSASCFVIMNRYPYNNGHLMVIPFQHEKELDQLPAATAVDMTQTLQKTVAVLKKTFKPDGFNIGINLGAAAGAGIPGHLHYHVIPRWIGDTNFMPILNDVRVMNEYLKDTYARLVGAFA
jgi:ATP adenylyltransferase